jgi:hypothetical protein
MVACSSVVENDSSENGKFLPRETNAASCYTSSSWFMFGLCFGTEEPKAAIQAKKYSDKLEKLDIAAGILCWRIRRRQNSVGKEPTGNTVSRSKANGKNGITFQEFK